MADSNPAWYGTYTALARRVLRLQAALIVVTALAATLLVGTAIYFHQRMAVLQAQIAASPPGSSTSASARPMASTVIDDDDGPLAAPSAEPLPTPAVAALPSPTPMAEASPPGVPREVRALREKFIELARVLVPGDGASLSPQVRAEAERMLAEIAGIVRADPTLAAVDDAEGRLAAGYQVIGNLDAAAEWANAWLNREPNLAQPRVILAQVAAMQGEWPAALDEAERALAIDPSAGEAALLRAAALEALNRTDEAIAAYGQLADDGVDAAGAWALQATLLEGAGRHEEAVASARRAINAGANQPELYAVLGSSLLQLEEFAAARDALLEATNVPNPPADPLLDLGVAQIKLRDSPAAAAALDAALEQRPDWHLALHYRGIASLNRGRLTEARDFLSRAVAADPTHGPSHTALGLTYWNLREFQLAREQLEEAVERPDSPPEAGLLLAMALQHQGFTLQARERLAATLQAHPTVRGKAEQLAEQYPALKALME